MAKASNTETKPKKMVKTTLMKDNGKYKDDVFVCVNGKPYAVKRGMEVEIPEAVDAVIKASMKQDGNTAALIQTKEDEFTEQTK